MSEKIITAISFLYDGERHVVKSSGGKFKVPVTEVVDGNLKTTNKLLTAKQILSHEVIKKCDPTFYLEGGRKHRVFQAGDSRYLPAESEGIAEKHDTAHRRPLLKLKKSIKPLDKPQTNGYNKDVDWKQETMDMYGVWPYDEDYHD